MLLFNKISYTEPDLKLKNVLLVWLRATVYRVTQFILWIFDSYRGLRARTHYLTRS